LERRLAEFKAEPSISMQFEPDYCENLKRQLADRNPGLGDDFVDEVNRVVRVI